MEAIYQLYSSNLPPSILFYSGRKLEARKSDWSTHWTSWEDAGTIQKTQGRGLCLIVENQSRRTALVYPLGSRCSRWWAWAQGCPFPLALYYVHMSDLLKYNTIQYNNCWEIISCTRHIFPLKKGLSWWFSYSKHTNILLKLFDFSVIVIPIPWDLPLFSIK